MQKGGVRQKNLRTTGIDNPNTCREKAKSELELEIAAARTLEADQFLGKSIEVETP